MISIQALTDVPAIGDTIKLTKISLNSNSQVPAGDMVVGILNSLAIGCEIKIFGDKDHYQGKYDGRMIRKTTPVMAMSIDQKDGAIYAQTFTSTYKLELVNSKYQKARKDSDRRLEQELGRAFAAIVHG